MSERTYRMPETQGMRHVTYSATLKGAGAAAPTFLEGDLVGKSAGSFMTVARTSQGIYTIKVLDPVLAVVDANFTYSPATPGAAFVVSEGPLPSQGTDNAWTFTINVYSSTVLTDIPTTDRLRISLIMRNSTVLP